MAAIAASRGEPARLALHWIGGKAMLWDADGTRAGGGGGEEEHGNAHWHARAHAHKVD